MATTGAGDRVERTLHTEGELAIAVNAHAFVQVQLEGLRDASTIEAGAVEVVAVTIQTVGDTRLDEVAAATADGYTVLVTDLLVQVQQRAYRPAIAVRAIARQAYLELHLHGV
ncbi:hypothetical protein L7F22_017646 [Adiantum nelumboides]|nr:hypothetical protein [Adiantum nelumboides]